MPKYSALAKINLSLRVTGRRDDGYHALDTLVTFADIGDVVSVEAANTVTLQIGGRFSQGLATGNENLVLKAASLLERNAKDCGIAVGGAAIRLTKNLPIASGIGGGSADAAASLRALGELWQLDMDLDALLQLAPQLGADVAMCLHSKPLVARGIGEQITPVSMPELHLVLINPGVEISTAGIFSLLQLEEKAPSPLPDNPFSQQRLLEWLGQTGNDLELPAIRVQPVIQVVLDWLRGGDCLFAGMSGSGATCFGVYSSKDSAKATAQSAAHENPSWWCVATSTIGSI